MREGGERRRDGQVSAEYVLILSFIFVLLIPAILFFYHYSKGSVSTVTSAQFDKLGQEMLALALQSSAQGDSSWLSLDASIPQGLVDIRLGGSGQDELIFSYRTIAGVTEAVYFSDVKLCANATSTGECPKNGTIFVVAPHDGRAGFRFTTVMDGVDTYVAIKELST